MRILVTGAEGQLARSIACRVPACGADEYLFATKGELDITNRESVLRYVAEQRVDVIVNCAAYTNVEQAEREEAQAHLVNATAVGYLAEAAKVHNALLVHISTDYVFMGGCCAMLTEESHPQPINAYGRSKLAGEEAVRASGCHYVILRTAWLYSEWGHNFVKTMLRLTSERESLRVVSDQIGSPTYAGDLAKAIVRIISERNFHEGIFHYTNLGECSWWQFAQEITRLAEHSCQINPCTTDEYGAKVARPLCAVLDKSRFQRTFGIEIPEWRTSLQKCINELKKL